MSYKIALDKAWSELESLIKERTTSVKLLADEYTVDLSSKTVSSLSCNGPAKEYVSILILHYLIKKLKGIPELTNKWISFRELPGAEGYYPTFHKRVIERMVNKIGNNTDKLLSITERLPAKRIQYSDAGIVIEVFEKLPVMITFWKADEEFSGEANVLFDKSIKEIYPTEDVVVLAEFIISQL